VDNAIPSGLVVLDSTLYYVPDHASFVFTRSIRGIKGSDASNLYDEEINDDVSALFCKLTYRNENFLTMKLKQSTSGV
jgi:hypothetical protein